MSESPKQTEAVSRARRLAIGLHRYVGLAMTVFLVVAGLTGSLLVFHHELDSALNPHLLRAQPPRSPAAVMDPFERQERITAAIGSKAVDRVVQFALEPGETISTWVEVEEDKWRQVFVDPHSAKVVGSRHWGDLTDGFTTNLMPFVYRLHYSLALGDVGILLFGIVGLLWTVDCFVGAYLTFPAPQRRDGARSSWLRRWLPAWRLRTSKLFSLVFSWHRASGLWVWALLLVFAWSAVGLNLPQVYKPVMQATTGMQPWAHDLLPELKKPYPEPRFSMREAYDIGKRLMAEHAERRGFKVKRELLLRHLVHHGAFSYEVESSLDISRRFARTEVYFDAKDGRLLGFDAPTGVAAGNTITAWLYMLHFGGVGGIWYRILVAIIGVGIALLSVTGVWIWLRKRSKRRPAASAGQSASAEAPAGLETATEPQSVGST